MAAVAKVREANEANEAKELNFTVTSNANYNTYNNTMEEEWFTFAEHIYL